MGFLVYLYNYESRTSFCIRDVILIYRKLLAQQLWVVILFTLLIIIANFRGYKKVSMWSMKL